MYKNVLKLWSNGGVQMKTLSVLLLVYLLILYINHFLHNLYQDVQNAVSVCKEKVQETFITFKSVLDKHVFPMLPRLYACTVMYLKNGNYGHLDELKEEFIVMTNKPMSIKIDIPDDDELASLKAKMQLIVEKLPTKRYLRLPDIPRFGDPLNNLTVSLGREATFICVVDDLGPYKVAWLRVDTQTILTIAGHVITKNDRIKVRHSGSRVWYLTILEVRQTDRGWYMCQINTDPMKNQIAYLDVVVPPDILDYLTSDDQVAREGSNVTLKCGAIGVPTPTLIWRREGGEPLRRHNVVDEHNTSITSAVLEFVRVNRMSMGAYLCIASNGIPPSVSKRIMLIVHFPPIVSIENQLRGADDGDSEVLECHSEAFPNSINFWTFNDQIISQTNPSYEISNKASGYAVEMRLKIRSVSRKTLGSYRCVAKNSLGDTDGTIKLYSRSGSSFEIDEDNSIEFFSETGSKSAARSQSTTLLHSTPFFQSFTRNPIEKLSSLLFVFIYVIIFFEFG